MKINFLKFIMLAIVSSMSGIALADSSVYNDSLQNGWANWSWATVNFNSITPVHLGTKSISVNAAANQALYLHHDPLSLNDYQGIRVWINGGCGGCVIVAVRNDRFNQCSKSR